MQKGERKIRQEDCSEDSLGTGILTLTNQRIAFDKSQGRIMDFTKHEGDTILDLSLSDITKVWKEGRFIRKLYIRAGGESPKTYKFGVFRAGSWAKSIQNALDDL